MKTHIGRIDLHNRLYVCGDGWEDTVKAIEEYERPFMDEIESLKKQVAALQTLVLIERRETEEGFFLRETIASQRRRDTKAQG